MLVSHYFGVPLPRKLEFECVPTVLRVAKETDKGVYFENVVLEKELNCNVGLHYTDFTILNLLKAGIKPTSIHLSKDIRIGSDKEIEAFNAHVDELAESMFNN